MSVKEIKFSRAFSMPNAHTFKMKPVKSLLERYIPAIRQKSIFPLFIVDPFARDSRWATVTNDLNPAFDTDYHLDAVEFLDMISAGMHKKCDVVLFDPPYSPRQISECYQQVGRAVTTKDTQNARLYKDVKSKLDSILRPGGIAISFGWNSMGFGLTRGYEVEEIVLITHGAAHNDTIVTVERKLPASAQMNLRAD